MSHPHFQSTSVARAWGAIAFIAAVLPALAAAQTTTTTATPAFGTFERPFSADSLWNSKPVAPVLGTFVIPTSLYYPAIGPGTLSTAVFKASASDGPMVVSGVAGSKGLWDPDAEAYTASITIPHWPAATAPATGADGHADIVDTTTGITHSFWQLKQVNGAWVASSYAWTPISGKGWGEVAHYYHGARAAAVPPIAGLIRISEINDGAANYNHALAMSLTNNALGYAPTYVFPATSADSTAATTNTGQIPEGALVMLPSTFDTSTIANLDLRKIANTLKVYGAYVVDRNYGTPYYIYVENGADFNLHKGGWNTVVAADLDRIRAALRMVVSNSGYLDGNGVLQTPVKPTNRLSMRGPWLLKSGPALGTFDTWSQSVIFPVTGATRIVQQNYTGRSMVPLLWSAAPKVGDTLRLTVNATGGATLKLQVRTSASSILLDLGELGDKQSVRFVWPTGGAITVLYANSGINGASSVSGIVEAVTP